MCAKYWKLTEGNPKYSIKILSDGRFKIVMLPWQQLKFTEFISF